MFYNHTQVGRLMIGVLIAMVILFGSILIADFELGLLIFSIFLLFTVASFSSLNVIVDESHVRIKFGYGITKFNFELKEIASVKVVKNHWYYGWGVRVCLMPYMRIYNVSGFDAVELKMKDDKVYRIGTDEPIELEYAIRQRLGKQTFI